MPPRKSPRPVLVEYLLRLVWNHKEYKRLVRDRASAVESLEKAGLSAKQRAAVLAAMKGDRRKLEVAVAEECREFTGEGDYLWNATNFIFGSKPTSGTQSGKGPTQPSDD
jgi:hypothetical protein